MVKANVEGTRDLHCIQEWVENTASAAIDAARRSWLNSEYITWDELIIC